MSNKSASASLADIRYRSASSKSDNNRYKRFSTNDVSSDTLRQVRDYSLKTYYCMACGTICLILQSKRELGDFPSRRTDKSLVVDRAKFIKKNRLVNGPVKLLKRKGGLERQFRLNCPGCNLFCAYHSTAQGCPYLYVLDRALTAESNVLMAKTTTRTLSSSIPDTITSGGSTSASTKPENGKSPRTTKVSCIRSGSGDDTTVVIVRSIPMPSASKSAVIAIKDNCVQVIVAASTDESSQNLELQQFVANTLNVLVRAIELDWDEDPSNIRLVCKGIQPHNAHLRLTAACDAHVNPHLLKRKRGAHYKREATDVKKGKDRPVNSRSARIYSSRDVRK